MSGTDMHNNKGGRMGTPPAPSYAGGQFSMNTPHSNAMSPFGNPTPKSVAFELVFTQSPQQRARLPMRVQIFPHDTTDSIITTVKNFYGLYAGPGGAKGVSFEDEQGNTLIARYENFRNNMVVYVRVILEESSGAYGPSPCSPGSPRLKQAYYPGDAQHLPPHPAQALSYGQAIARPTSRTSQKRSTSPGQGRGRRSASASLNPSLPTKKSRSRSGFKSRGSSTHGSFQELHSDGLNGYSSGDGGAGSVTSKARSEHIGNTEISLDNIVEGGRRKRAKFESSELPLFAPPQMPAATSNSSLSPARRMEHQRSSFPYTGGFAHNPFSNPPTLQSPQSYGNGFGQPGMYSTPAAQGRRTRGSYPSGRQSISTPGNTSGILPTPDPTVGSCMSEEDKDVALQLMRLGDMSNISHGRTSASTLDDTFSGRADAASSTGATSDSESESETELPPARRIKREPSPILPPGFWKKAHPHLDDTLPTDSTDPSSDERDYEDGQDGTFKPGHADDAVDNEEAKPPKVVKAKAARKPLPSVPSIKTKVNNRVSKSNRPGPLVKPRKANSVSASSKGPISPTSLPSQSRKTSVASAATHQHHLGDDEEDLSSKPRCQRCRKSKKGCDRQRPCGRCQDAGLGADQCVSEDEGNGRKGRYGRHMGVPVKKDELPQVPIFPSSLPFSGAGSFDKSRKRKR
ncbi:hypothetical protein SBOR_5353 [Sclerotinia borealis F-4128]|uniref:Zn(2)-C6 fungal-type domain-containing protein n=1 Tax=Sclerotinia borealis (strain F-4128) TaxID=1432307 RepID=W9CIC9_SCLBF|nr:hypothetical protein SBOR_5353 [Sclerotinia borealis F-4128]